ncbi:hypothetical protein P852_04756 [Enterobacter asburiae]|nr:hypothetical protein P852_04756 [Enterobacter asburiae]
MSEAVNGLAIYCGIVRSLPGVGAASPDEKHLWCRVCAVLQMHILSAALTFVIQERQMTSLCGVSPILHRIKKCSTGVYGAEDKPADIPLPRSLTRCARSFGCGERRG